MEFLFKFIALFMALYAIYQLGSLAGLFSESSGVANIAIEGNMVLGAVIFAILFHGMSTTDMPKELSFFFAFIIAVPLSATYMMLLGHLTNRYMADHIIAGTGLNLLAPAIGFFAYHFLVNAHSINISATGYADWFWQIKIDGVVYPLQSLFVIFIIVVIVIVVLSFVVLNKTSFGLRLKSSGENPYSLETSGVSVARTRMYALFISGLLASMAGVIFVTKDTFWFTVNGSGFLSIGILILGQYKVIGTVIGSIVFALFISLFTNLPFLVNLNGFDDLLKTLPFLIPIIGLMVFRKHSAPACAGMNFKKDQR